MEKTTKERLETVLIEWIETRKDNIDDATINAIPEVANVLLNLLNSKESVAINDARGRYFGSSENPMTYEEWVEHKKSHQATRCPD